MKCPREMWCLGAGADPSFEVRRIISEVGGRILKLLEILPYKFFYFGSALSWSGMTCGYALRVRMRRL